jgi:hypothetical protein
MRRLLLVAGQMAQGKDVLSDYLAKYSGYDWVRTAFADKVKDVFSLAFGMSREFIEEWKRKPEPPPGFQQPIRQCLIDIGNGFRKWNPNVWVDAALRQKGNLIISDGRYLNELQAVKRQGGKVILLWRPGFENSLDSPSEQELMPLTRALIQHKVRGRIPEHLQHLGLHLVDFFVVNDKEQEVFCQETLQLLDI